MSATSFPDPIRAASRNAFPVEPELLNSERIGERFGSCGIEILAEADGLRRANLYSVDGDERICRTYALVRTLDTAPEIAAEQAAIGGGQSIGATFRASGWTVSKKTLLTGTLDTANVDPDVAKLMRLVGSASLAMHAYELLVERDASRIRYAMILELHHPEHLTKEDLAALFPTPAGAPASRQEFAKFLRHFDIFL
jgi:hypothetical protein